MNLIEILFGRPLATEEEKAERIGPLKGIPIFGLDALSSAAYGPEAALTLLIPLGMAGSRYVWPITIGIVMLLGIVYFSYRQTIAAYPHGGGSYTVATENLGRGAGLLAAAALMIDYVLTAAVGISAGVGALVSAAPSLQPHTLSLCLAILILITIINLRGVQETGGVFLLPTYIFIACLLGLIAVGLFNTILAGGHPVPVVALPKLSGATTAVSAWLLLRTFSSGCTAMTGVEAVSNGVMAFREPTDKYAKLTLTIIIGILILMLLGIAFLVPAYGIAATDPGMPGYDSVLSQLLAAVTGRGAFYWLSIGSILVVLSLGEYRLRRLPASRPRHRAKWVPPSCVRFAWASFGFCARHLLAGPTHRNLAGSFSGCHRPFNSALCSGRVSGLHPFAGWHGDALEAPWRSGFLAQHAHEWPGSPGDWCYDRGCAGCEIHRRRLDHGFAYSRPDVDDAFCKEALRAGWA